MKEGSIENCASSDECRICSEKVVALSIAGSIFLAILKFTGGALSHSAGLTADGIESIAFTIGGMLIMYSLLIAKKKPDDQFPHGYGKVEFIVALVVFSSLIGIGFFISLTSMLLILRRDFAPPDIRGLPVAAISVFVNYMIFRYSLCAGEKLEDSSIIANAYQGKADMLSSIAVGVGILLSQLGSGFAIFDPLAALLVGILILKDAFGQWFENLEVLLDKVPDSQYRDTVSRIIEESLADAPVQFIKFKRTGKKFWIGVGLDFPSKKNVEIVDKILDAIKDKIQKNFHWAGEINFFVAEEGYSS